MTTSTPRAEPTDGSPPKKSRLKVWVLRIGMIVLSPLLVLFLFEMIWQLVGDPRYPDYDEFMSQVVKKNDMWFPVLPAGAKYQYDEKNHKLVVIKPARKAPQKSD